MYKAELDGLRSISILLVIISHAGFGHLVPGGLGVTIFFFISGYLITSLLLSEYQRAGEINLYKFYMRRFWRLLPPVLVFIFAASTLIYLVNHSLPINQLAAALLYFANYYKIFFHFDMLANIAPSPFNILWSLAIEEHFYLLFAPLLAFTIKTKGYIKVVLLFLFLPMIIRISAVAVFPDLLKEGGYCYSATETRIDSIAFGCFLAIISFYNSFTWLSASFKRLPTFWISGAILLSTLIIRNEYFRETIRYTLQNIAILGIIGSILMNNHSIILAIKRILSCQTLVHLGKLSYSLYLYHWLSLIITTLIVGNGLLTLAWQVSYWALTFVFAYISYFVVEIPTLTFRRKFGSNV